MRALIAVLPCQVLTRTHEASDTGVFSGDYRSKALRCRHCTPLAYRHCHAPVLQLPSVCVLQFMIFIQHAYRVWSRSELLSTWVSETQWTMAALYLFYVAEV